MTFPGIDIRHHGIYYIKNVDLTLSSPIVTFLDPTPFRMSGL